jgi:GNAT superfamily N-acetyltransferase
MRNVDESQLILRKARISELPIIWNIIQQAIEQRRQDGSTQWQDGYPNESTITNDIERGYGHVLSNGGAILAYAAIIFDKEPAYEVLKGDWLTNDNYVNVHRVAVVNSGKGKGIATRLFTFAEQLAIDRHVYSIKIDTNFDNKPMLRILDKLGYTYCGEVHYDGSPRKAFEKTLGKIKIDEN